jgi:hypothetical protein
MSLRGSAGSSHETPTITGESAERPAPLWKETLNLLYRSPVELLPFEEVRTRLQLRPGLFRGLRQIPLDRIIGSVGRYHDFDRAFLPHRADDLWQRINTAWQRGEQLPPIEVYQVSEVYFVCDGNHRVSVARAMGSTAQGAVQFLYYTRLPEGGCLYDDSDPGSATRCVRTSSSGSRPAGQAGAGGCPRVAD